MSDAWLLLCKDRPCVACGAQDGTVVPAHSNQQAHGKGMGIKASDWTVIPLCRGCHEMLDMRLEREHARNHWQFLWTRHHMALCQAGLIAPHGKPPREGKYKKPTKSLAHPGYSR